MKISTLYPSLILIQVIIFLGCASEPERYGTGPEEGVKYIANRDSTRIDWTVHWQGNDQGFTGSFERVDLSIPKDMKTPATALSAAAMEIHVTMMDAGDIKLNSAIVEYIFGKDEANYMITGAVVSLEGTEANGMVRMALGIAGKADTLTLDYTVNDDVLELWGTIDLERIGLADRLEPLNRMYGDGEKMEAYIDLYLISRFTKVKGGGNSISLNPISKESYNSL